MKRWFHSSCRQLPLLALIALATVGPVGAQTFNIVCDLSPWDAGPPDLLLSGSTFYWTTPGNPLGAFGHVGSVYKANTDGSGLLRLHNFDAYEGFADGYHPLGGLVLSSNRLYGTTAWGGSISDYNLVGNGTVFALNTDGTGYQTLYRFTGTNDGSTPCGELVLSGDTLYGAARQAGTSGNGTIFKLTTGGTAFSILYSFSGVFHLDPNAPITNHDGAYPEAELVLSGNTLYGTARGGGDGGAGTVFALNTDGTGFRTLHSFTAVDPATGTNSDGASPAAALVLSGNTLYGAASSGGASSNGTIFKINIDGTGFTVLHHFAPSGPNASSPPTNSDGIAPLTRLFLSEDTLFGTANGGGGFGYGTVFALKTDGTDFKVVKSFTVADANPTSGLVPFGNGLYGGLNTGQSGNGAGALYRLLFLAPPLSITRSGADVILTWPTGYAGFSYSGYTLESSVNLASSVWTAVSPDPVIINGQYTVTNAASGTEGFYRLVQ